VVQVETGGVTVNDTIVVKQGNTKKPWVFNLGVDLTGAASVKIYTRPKSGGGNKITGATCTIVSPATNGQVSYTPVASDVNTPDTYIVQFDVTDGAGLVDKLPDSGYFTLIVDGSLS
jgi:hypothetical protein